MSCGRCHACGTILRSVLDGEEWCPICQTYRRYVSHGWSSAYGETSPCIQGGTMETRVQYDLFGAMHAPQDMDLRGKVAYVMENHPETRDDDRLFTLWFWWEWDGLNNIISNDKFQELLAWVETCAEKPETIRRRRQEIHQLRTGTGSLLPSADVAAFRRERDSAGPPRRGRK